jgi:hypothetical protein
MSGSGSELGGVPYSPAQLKPASPAAPLPGIVLLPAGATSAPQYGVDEQGDYEIEAVISDDIRTEVPNTVDADGIPREAACHSAAWQKAWCDYLFEWLAPLSLANGDTCEVVETECDEEVITGKKFTLAEVFLGVPTKIHAKTPQRAVQSLSSLTTAVNDPNKAKGIRTFSILSKGVTAPTPKPPSTPSAPPAITGVIGIVRIIIIGTTQAFDSNARLDFITALAQLYGLSAANFEILSASAISVSAKFETSATSAIAVIVRITDPNATSAAAILTKLQNLVRQNGNHIGAYTVVSIDQNNDGSTAAAWSRPSLWLALAAIVAVLLF